MRNFKCIKNVTDLQFSHENVKQAINKTNPSKALGLDDLAPLMLKKLGDSGISSLTTTINISLGSLVVPNIWKTARVIPLLKPGKPADEASSHRPISLLSPIAKIIEKLIAPSINNNIKLASHQHGFRKCHSTTTALHAIHH